MDLMTLKKAQLYSDANRDEAKAYADGAVSELGSQFSDTSSALTAAISDFETTRAAMVANGTESANAVTLAAVTTTTYSKNFWIPANILSNYYVSTSGVQTSNATYTAMRNIPVTEGQIVVASRNSSGSRTVTQMRYICAYNSSGTAVSGSGAQSVNSYTVPSGITKLDISIASNLLNEIMIEVTEDGVNTSYEAYHAPIHKIKTTAVSDQISAALVPFTAADTAINSNISQNILPRVNVILNHLFGGTKIYGVSWDKSTSPTLTRTDDAVGMTANAGVDTTTVTNDFDTADIFKSIQTVQDGSGNYFIRIPKFYIAKTVGDTSETLKISKMPIEGSYLPKCFWDFTNSKELAYFDFGKYLASSAGGTLLESKPNTYPLTYNKNITNYRTMAAANGTGYQQFDIHAWDVMQALMTIEFATLDMQTIMMGWVNGAGETHATVPASVLSETGVNRVVVTNANAVKFVVGTPIAISVDGANRFENSICYGRIITSIEEYDASNKAIYFDGAAVNTVVDARVYNTAWKNGFSSGISASSGSIVSNSDGLHPCSYRGIENPYGNAFQWCDGVNIEADYKAWVCDNAAQYQSSLFQAPYKRLSYDNWNWTGNIKNLGYDPANPFARFPIDNTADGGGYTTYYSDRYYQDTGPRTVPIGGYWAGGRGCGPYTMWPAYGANNTGANFAARLMRKVLS